MTQPTQVSQKPQASKRGALPIATDGIGGSAWRPEPGWRDVLAGRQPDLILRRLMDGDPLRLRSLVAGVIRGGAYFLNADRVQLRALARIAHDVPIHGPPSDGAWIHDHVEAALADVLVEERRAVAGRQADDVGDEMPCDALNALAGPLGFDGRDLRVACDAFNRLQPRDRRAFFALVIERRSLDDAAKACQLTPAELGKRARVALVSTMDAVKKSLARAAAPQLEKLSQGLSNRPSHEVPH